MAKTEMQKVDMARISPFVGLFDLRSRPTDQPRPFLVADVQTLTYPAMADIARRLATLFRERGLRCGDRGVIASFDDVVVASLFLGMLASGITAVVLDPDASEAELRVLLAASDASILFLDDEVLARLRREDRADQEQDVVLVVAIRQARDSAEGPEGRHATHTVGPNAIYPDLLDRLVPAPTLPSDVPAATTAYILFTSGTTSTPKGVMVSHSALYACFETMCRQFGYTESSRILNVLPMFHADGLCEGAAMAYFCGATLHRPMRFAVQRITPLLETIAREGITHFHAVPTMLALIERGMEEQTMPFAGPHFRHVISSGGPLPEDLWRRFESRFGVRITNVYGLTEAARELLYCGPDEETRRVGTNGKPVGCEARIVDDDGNMVATGQVGELLFRAENFMTGYLDAPEETAALLRDGWLYTGDLAVRDADGFYTITGRKKNVIISGGINVYPEDVSRAIARMPGIVDAVTLGVADETWGERVVSCVVTARPGAPTAEQVIEHCRAHMAREKVPSQVLILEQLPRGPSGKVALPEVRSLVAARLAAAEAQVSDAIAWSPEQVSERVMQLAAQSFKTTLSELTLDSEAESTPGWSSLAHMDFLLGIESTFGLKLSPADMLSIISLGDAIDLVLEVVARRASR